MLSKLFTAHYVLFIKLVLVGLVSPEPSFKRFRWKDYINFATNQLSDSSKWQLCTPYPRKKTSPHIRLSLCHACFLHVSLVAPCTDPLLTTQPSDAALLIMSLFLHWQLKSPSILFSKSCKLFPSLKFIKKRLRVTFFITSSKLMQKLENVLCDKFRWKKLWNDYKPAGNVTPHAVEHLTGRTLENTADN